jgi:hypothetical protein
VTVSCGVLRGATAYLSEAKNGSGGSTTEVTMSNVDDDLAYGWRGAAGLDGCSERHVRAVAAERVGRVAAGVVAIGDVVDSSSGPALGGAAGAAGDYLDVVHPNS